MLAGINSLNGWTTTEKSGIRQLWQWSLTIHLKIALISGMKMLGVEWQHNGTSGQEESASLEGKHGEKITSTMDGKPEIASGLR